MLRHLWQRADTEGDRAFAALVFLSWICFWRVGEAASVHPFDLLEAGGGGVSFYHTKSGGPKGWHRRPLFKFGMSWAGYLSDYCVRQKLPLEEAIFCGGGGGQCWKTGWRLSSADPNGAIMHGTASGEGAPPPVGTRSLGYPTSSDGAVGLLLGLPCATRQLSLIMECWHHWPCHALVRKSESLKWSTAMWSSAMFGADAVDETLVYVGAILGLARQYSGAVAVEPPATAVGSGDGGNPGHESVLLQAPRGPAPVSHPTHMSGSSTHRSGRGFPQAQPSRSKPRGIQWGGTGGGGGGGTAKAQMGSPPRPPSERRIVDVELGLWASPVILKGGGCRLARRWEWRVSAPGSPLHPNAVFLGPSPRKLRWGRDHCLNDLPLEMRGRARVPSRKP